MRSNSLLNKLLRALVEEWGYQRVESELARMLHEDGGADSTHSPAAATRYNRKSRRQTSAIEQVTRAEFAPGKKEALAEIARRFDKKMFLPTSADIREFLVMLGEKPQPTKDRAAAFRYLLTPLSALPAERLKYLASSSLHSGPSQLGPISDAISDAAASLPRNQDTDNKS